jgi:hypothetical protein
MSIAIGLGTFRAQVAVVKDKKEATSTDLNTTDVFTPTPLPKGKILNLTKSTFSGWPNQELCSCENDRRRKKEEGAL